MKLYLCILFRVGRYGRVDRPGSPPCVAANPQSISRVTRDDTVRRDSWKNLAILRCDGVIKLKVWSSKRETTHRNCLNLLSYTRVYISFIYMWIIQKLPTRKHGDKFKNQNNWRVSISGPFLVSLVICVMNELPWNPPNAVWGILFKIRENRPAALIYAR